MAFVKFWADVESNFVQSKAQEDTLYFITDTYKLYKGQTLIADKTPDNLPNEYGFELYDNNGTKLHTYDGSSVVNLKAGAFVEFTESPDGTIAISSANTTYTLSGKASDNTWVTTLTPSSGNPTTSIVPAMTGATSTEDGAVGLVPAPTEGQQSKFLKGDGTWDTPTDTTYSDMVGATSNKAGTHGLVPAPAKGQQSKFLCGDGSWQTPTNTTGKNIVGGETGTSDTVVSTNGVYLKHIEGSTTVKSSHKISGSGKISVTSDASGNITINGAETTLDELGLANAMHYLGTSSTEITDGGTQKPTIGGSQITPKAGDVVLYSGKEYIYNSSNAWESFGDEGSYLLKSKVSTAALKGSGTTNTTATTKIYAVQEGTDGKLAVHVPWTDTNTKVTTVSNHYAPAADDDSVLEASAAGGSSAEWAKTQLVTGVELQRDAAGHVVGVAVDSVAMPANPNTDTTYAFASGDANGQIKVTPSSGTAYNVDVKGLTAAAYKEISDSRSAAALSSTGQNLVTERDVYHGLPTINGSHSYKSSTNIYAPTSTGTANQVLISTGSTTKTPTWANLDDLESVKSLKAALTWGSGSMA